MISVHTRVKNTNGPKARELRVTANPDGSVEIRLGDAPPANHPDDLYNIETFNFPAGHELTWEDTYAIAKKFYGVLPGKTRPACTGSMVGDLNDMIARHFENQPAPLRRR